MPNNRKPLNPLGQAIQKRRGDETRKALAERAGVDENYIYKIERSGTVPSDKKLRALAVALKADTEVETWLAMAALQRQALLARSSTIDDTLEFTAPENHEQGLNQVLASLPGQSEEDLENLKKSLSFVVRAVWSMYDKGVPHYLCSHSGDHPVYMVRLLAKYFKSEIRTLTRTELRVLLSAIFLHDVGLLIPDEEVAQLLPDYRKQTNQESWRLQKYHMISAAYVRQKRIELGLSDPDVLAGIAELCEKHRIVEPTDTLRGDRQEAMLGLLRLASLMDARPARVKGRALKTFQPVPSDLYNEVLRNLYCRLYRDESGKLFVDYIADLTWGPADLGVLAARLEHDVITVLDRSRGPLNSVFRSNLYKATLNQIPAPADYPIPREQLKGTLSLLGTSRSPNAARVFETMVHGLELHLAPERFEVAVTEIEREIEQYLRIRPYHAQIANLFEDLSGIMKQPGASGSERRVLMTAKVNTYNTVKNDAYARIQEFARTNFAHEIIVVFGFSASVLTFLEAIDRSKQYTIYVCECRNKTIYHELDNAVDYCDGVEYARKIKELGFSRIWLISDAAISYYISGGVLLLGADGLSPRGEISGTVGTATVAAAAHASGGKVWVLADGNKLRGGDLRWKGPRDNNWLATDARLLATLEGGAIEIAQPLNELVPPEFINRIITEKGCLTVEEFKSAYKGHPHAKGKERARPSHEN